MANIEECLRCGEKFDWDNKRYCPDCGWDRENHTSGVREGVT